MADMYSLPSYMNGPSNLSAVDGIYTLPNYHAVKKLTGESDASSRFTVIDPIKRLGIKQEELIVALAELGNTLNAILKSKGQEKSKKEDNASDGKNKCLSIAANNAESALKKDKNAKKEMRKNAKQDAKSKLASHPKGTTSNAVHCNKDAAWTVKVGNSLSKGQSLEACNKPELTRCIAQDLGNIEMTITNNDVPWVAALSVIGNSRRVAFPGKVGNSANAAETGSSVTVRIADSFTVIIKDVCIKSRVAAWKLLGCSLGLFSVESSFSLQAAHQHHWLEKAERVLEKQIDISFLQREMSQYLSRFDTLGSHFDIGIADIILRSLLLNERNYANNVELWAYRVDNAVKINIFD